MPLGAPLLTPLLIAATACTGLDLDTRGETSPAVGVPSNLLILSVDTLRRDHVSADEPWAALSPPASEVPVTPGFFTPHLQQRAWVLDDHASCSNWTLHSMTCALSARSPLEWGFDQNAFCDEGDAWDDVKRDYVHLPDVLGTAGFESGIVTSNGYLGPDYLGGQGFDVVVESGPDDDPTTRFGCRKSGRGYGAPASWVIGHGQNMLPLLASQGDRWFLQLHFSDPHTPYIAPDLEGSVFEATAQAALPGVNLACPEEFSAARDSYETLDVDGQAQVLAAIDAMYRAEVESLDGELAALWDWLLAEGWLDDTLVLLVADHGEQFQDHHQWGHRKSVYPEETTALAALWAPELAPGSWDEPTLHQDLLPTVLDMLGVPAEWKGSPLALEGAIVGRASGDRVRHASFSKEDQVAHRLAQDGWVFHYDWDGSVALFDAVEDPLEQVDLAGGEPERVAELWDALVPYVQRTEEVLPCLAPVDPGL